MLPDLADAVTAARNLLGWELIHTTTQGMSSGYIVETEAYEEHDPASHTFGGLKIRNASMFEPAGTVYVYFTYGMHYCVNIVSGPKGSGQGVLIRALQPVQGIELMKQRRKQDDARNLTNGPGKLTQALGITLHNNGQKLQISNLSLKLGFTPKHITQTTRIGISRSTDVLARFLVSDSPFVSRRAPTLQ